MSGGCWGPPRSLGRSRCSWGTASSSPVTASALAMPHWLPWHDRSKARLWQVWHSREAPSQGFWHRPGDAGKGLEQHGGAAGFGLGTEGNRDAVATTGLGSPPRVGSPPSAPRQLRGSSAVPKTGPSRPPSPCGFPNPSTKVPLATASPGTHQERLGAAHCAALLILLS